MKAKVFTTAAITAVIGAGLLAQDAQSNQANRTTPNAANKMTVTGCIERAAPSATGTSGSAAGSVSAPTFVLTNITPAAATSSGSTANAPAAGSSTAAGQTKMGSSYRLDADASKLTPHVGHKVEITGTVEEASASSSAAPPSSSSSSGASASAQMSAPRLKVDEVKMLAASCTQ